MTSISTKKSNIYYLLSGLLALGYCWLLLTLFLNKETNIIVCPVKLIAGFPCPSCGSTRSVVNIIEGDFLLAMYTNPIGLVIFIVLLIGPIWILYDLLKKKDTLLDFYQEMEFYIRKRKIAIPLIILVIANWIWNICKEL